MIRLALRCRSGEAEAVLGKLVVPPYRAQEGTYLVHQQGPSCAYYTAGHRAMVLSPTWEYGGMEVEAIRGVGGLIGQIAPVLLESPAIASASSPAGSAAR